MNIPDIFELYVENHLSKREKKVFEKELKQKPELAEFFKSYCYIHKLISEELKSPVLLYDNDSIIDELNLSQRMEIEEDVYRHFLAKNSDPPGDILSEDAVNETAQGPGYGVMNAAAEEPVTAEIKSPDPGIKKLQETRKIRQVIPYLKIAAAIFIAFFLIKILSVHEIGIGSKLSPGQVYSQFYNPLEDEELIKLNLTDNKLNGDLLEYQRNNLGFEAILSNQLKLSDTDYTLSLLNLGLIKMEQNKFQEAIASFNKILSSDRPFREYTARYYLALSYLKQEDLSHAMPLLNTLAETRNPYRQNARNILKRLKPD